jgi:hypothetical protein
MVLGVYLIVVASQRYLPPLAQAFDQHDEHIPAIGRYASDFENSMGSREESRPIGQARWFAAVLFLRSFRPPKLGALFEKVAKGQSGADICTKAWPLCHKAAFGKFLGD